MKTKSLMVNELRDYREWCERHGCDHSDRASLRRYVDEEHEGDDDVFHGVAIALRRVKSRRIEDLPPEEIDQLWRDVLRNEAQQRRRAQFEEERAARRATRGEDTRAPAMGTPEGFVEPLEDYDPLAEREDEAFRNRMREPHVSDETARRIMESRDFLAERDRLTAERAEEIRHAREEDPEERFRRSQTEREEQLRRENPEGLSPKEMMQRRHEEYIAERARRQQEENPEGLSPAELVEQRHQRWIEENRGQKRMWRVKSVSGFFGSFVSYKAAALAARNANRRRKNGKGDWVPERKAGAGYPDHEGRSRRRHEIEDEERAEQRRREEEDRLRREEEEENEGLDRPTEPAAEEVLSRDERQRRSREAWMRDHPAGQAAAAADAAEAERIRREIAVQAAADAASERRATVFPDEDEAPRLAPRPADPEAHLTAQEAAENRRARARGEEPPHKTYCVGSKSTGSYFGRYVTCKSAEAAAERANGDAKGGVEDWGVEEKAIGPREWFDSLSKDEQADVRHYAAAMTERRQRAVPAWVRATGARKFFDGMVELLTQARGRKALDILGGEEPVAPEKKLAAADFVTFPEGVDGANCGNCEYIRDGVCSHPKMDEQPVNERNCCSYWNSEGTLREWQTDKSMSNGHSGRS